MMCLEGNQNAPMKRFAVAILLLFLCCFRTIHGGQCSIGLHNAAAAAKPTALAFLESLLEQKFSTTINSAPAAASENSVSNKETTRQLVLQFIYQSLDKLINKQLQMWWKNDPDKELWNQLMDFPEPEPLIDLLACLDRFVTGQQQQKCHYLADLADLYAATKSSKQDTWLVLFLSDVLDSNSEGCANDKIVPLERSVEKHQDMDRDVDSVIEALTMPSKGTPISSSLDDWQHAELISQLNHELDTMNGTQFEVLRRQKLSLKMGSCSLMEFCANKLQQSEPIRLVDAEQQLKVDKFRSFLLSNVSLDGKSRKWIQFWLLCHKLLH